MPALHKALLTPHPATIGQVPRAFYDATDSDTIVPNGSDLNVWYSKFGGPLMRQTVASSQPEITTQGMLLAAGTHLTAEANYIFSQKSGYGLMAYAKPLFTPTSAAFIGDFGSHADYSASIIESLAQLASVTGLVSGGAIADFPGVIPSEFNTVFSNIIFGDRQDLFLGDDLKASEPITLTQLTAIEIRAFPTRQAGGGPMCIGRQSKNASESGRYYEGLIRAYFIFDDALNDVQRFKMGLFNGNL